MEDTFKDERNKEYLNEYARGKKLFHKGEENPVESLLDRREHARI